MRALTCGWWPRGPVSVVRKTHLAHSHLPGPVPHHPGTIRESCHCPPEVPKDGLIACPGESSFICPGLHPSLLSMGQLQILQWSLVILGKQPKSIPWPLTPPASPASPAAQCPCWWPSGHTVLLGPFTLLRTLGLPWPTSLLQVQVGLCVFSSLLCLQHPAQSPAHSRC